MRSAEVPSTHFDGSTVYTDLRGKGLEFWWEPPGVPPVLLPGVLTCYVSVSPREPGALPALEALLLLTGHQ